MNKCTLRFLRPASSDVTKDDVLTIRTDSEFADMLYVRFVPGELTRTHYEFYLDPEATVKYLLSILQSLVTDVDPYEYLQVETAIHPTVLYRVADLNEWRVRTNVEELLSSAVRRTIDVIRTPC
jgi:hypothetical protein